MQLAGECNRAKGLNRGTMTHRNRPLVLAIMLLAFGMRAFLGAPCCHPPAMAHDTAIEAADHAHHSDDNGQRQEQGAGHGGHGDDSGTNPCCSACGPTLPPEPAHFAERDLIRNVAVAKIIRELATIPPYPAYEARGPPLLI